MSEPKSFHRPGRRTLLLGGAAAGASLLLPTSSAIGAPALVRSGRPAITHGVQSGDVSASQAVVWARSDRPARMWVEVSPTETFRRVRRLSGPILDERSDFTGKTLLRGLPAGEDVFYRVVVADPDDDRRNSAPEYGRLRTAPNGSADIRFLWSADLAGQGWGIDPARGGYRIFEAMRRLNPDFFICSGDLIYADGVLPAEKPLPDGTVWRNLVTAEKSKVAETLAEYRGNYRYNLLDENLRRFNAEVPQINSWDDHEVTNNWYPGEILDDSRYTEKRVDVLAARARRAFHEYLPTSTRTDDEGRVYRVNRYGELLDVFVIDMRSYKDANTAGLEAVSDGGVFGRRQLDWLKRELKASRATWKVLAADLPISLVVPDGAAIEAIAQGDPGTPLGRELEIAELLAYAKRNRITGMVWVTGDVHYTAAHHYDPSRAKFTDFDPFWEFVSGPLNAAVGVEPRPNPVDPTFGPQVVFAKGAPSADVGNPAYGYQYFGEVTIDATTHHLTVNLRDQSGTTLHTTTLPPN
ncbi:MULTISPECIES: alkaline phosphatase D family protein [unclassified Kribbella]|uniref:alkaline phosphatase D family protein n=1 Tax=unclassified Kribbella TaxID=2644121 RepID=UPI0033D4011E